MTYTDNLKYMTGGILSWLIPGRARVIRKAFTLPYFDPLVRDGPLERLIRFYIARSSSQDPMRLETLHREFWRRQGMDGWHGSTMDRLEEIYQALHLFASLGWVGGWGSRGVKRGKRLAKRRTRQDPWGS